MLDADLLIAVPAGVVAAGLFGLTAALQHRADREVSDGSLSPRLILAAGRHPLWLLSLLTGAVGTACQAAALATGPLALVQPLLVSGLVFGAVFAAMLDRSRPQPVVLFSTLACLGGLSLFLILARPTSPATEVPSWASALPLAAALVLVTAGCLLVAAGTDRARPRSLALAVATGLAYGATAGLGKAAISQLGSGGWHAVLADWPVWCLVVAGPCGFLLNQQAFGASAEVSLALAVITIVEPLVSVLIGLAWLGETVAAGPGTLAGELLAAVPVLAGVAVLARLAPQAVEHPVPGGVSR